MCLHIISTVALTIQSTAERARARYADVTRQSARRINEEFDDEDQWMVGIVNLIRSPPAMTGICAHCGRPLRPPRGICCRIFSPLRRGSLCVCSRRTQLPRRRWSRRQHHVSYVRAVLNEMMGRGGSVEGKRASDLGLDRVLLRPAHQLTDPSGHGVDFRLTPKTPYWRS
jgi:hypothetical protein